jgi:hypothetical protein
MARRQAAVSAANRERGVQAERKRLRKRAEVSRRVIAVVEVHACTQLHAAAASAQRPSHHG